MNAALQNVVTGESDSRLAFALTLASQGFHIFPIRAGTKDEPLIKWGSGATRDTQRIQKWGARWPGCNWGIATGKFWDDKALLVVDVDSPQHGAGKKDGGATLKALEMDGRTFPPTLENATPTGGRHLIYTVDAAVKQGVDVLGAGLDIRSAGGYIAAPGSVVPAGEYLFERPAVPVAAPAWIIEACGAPRTKAVDRAPLPGIDPDRAMKRAIEYLATAPEAIEGAGGDDTTYRVAAKLLALGLDEAAAVDLLLSECWHDGCGWAPDDLADKVRNAAAYMQEPIGADAPEAVFEPVDDADPIEDAPATGHPFDELNKSWAVVAEPPNTVAYRVYENSTTGQQQFERYTREGFFGLLAHRKFDGAPLAAKWWESPRRRTYSGGIDFAPGKTLAADCLNTWGGFAVQPAPGDWSLMRTHIRSVICSDDPAIDAYVMGWLARLVQRPGEPGQVALVLRGGRGTGKGTLGEMLGKVFGGHGLHIGSAHRLTGNFNGHLMGKVYLFADEAFFAGKRADESTLKMLITERALDLEQKYQAARNVRNCLHILMASNESWVVPAGPLERRFCVIDISESQQQNNVYFGKIREQMDAGGLAAMLHDLLAYDLAGFDVWNVPNTQAGTEQRADSLRGPERWLFDALAEGRIAGEDWAADGVHVHKDAAYLDYRMRARDLGDYLAAHPVGFWKRVSNVLAAGGIQPKDAQLRMGIERKRVRILPSIEEARAAFDAWLGGTPTDWGET